MTYEHYLSSPKAQNVSFDNAEGLPHDKPCEQNLQEDAETNIEMGSFV
jgi:hypothetical protein